MSNHRTTIVGSEGAWQAKCSCKTHSAITPHRWEAEDWNLSHLRAVDRARAHLQPRTPSLKDQRDWYLKQAALATEPSLKRQWQMLADSLDHRIGPDPHDTPMF